jgi:two-component system, sensor histidine kinase and response regulator
MTEPKAPATILVVDDNEMNVELLSNMLERYHYRVISSLNGQDALKLVQAEKPEIVLLDINMPQMSGYEVCRHIKSEPNTSDIPVIFISALDDTENIVQGFDAGGVDYILKPFKFREVLARVDTQLTLYRQKRKIEELLQRERQQFETMDGFRKQFIGSATHDLKNPLFVVSGYTDMLEMLPIISENDQAKDFIGSIRRGITKMNTLVRDMLDLLQLEAAGELVKASCDFEQFLSDSVQDMRPRAEAKQLNFALYPPDEAATIQIDIVRMGRVMDNLVSNAIKYTPEGGSVEIIGKVGHTTVVIEVVDTGLGIPADALPNLFQPFERVINEEHMAQEGTGLGLSIVKTIVEQHEGKIEVESLPGKGSTFRVTIPMS